MSSAASPNPAITKTVIADRPSSDPRRAVRLAARSDSAARPSVLWKRLENPRTWDHWMRAPEFMPGVSRVKVLGGGEGIEPGSEIQVLHEDKSWYVLRVARWEAGKRLEVEVVREGYGDEPGQAPSVRRTERVLVIPQGAGSEVEVSLLFEMGTLRRMFAPLTMDVSGWQMALEARAQALAGV